MAPVHVLGVCLVDCCFCFLVELGLSGVSVNSANCVLYSLYLFHLLSLGSSWAFVY